MSIHISISEKTCSGKDAGNHFLTSREACDRLGYARPDSFIRVWRARGLPLYQRPGGHYLVAPDDVERFLRPVDALAHTGQFA